jgi:hypothetical protein
MGLHADLPSSDFKAQIPNEHQDWVTKFMNAQSA